MKNLFPFLLLILLGFAPSTVLQAVKPQQAKIVLSESQKIEQLYLYLETLKDVKFSRNGSYYNVNDAISHLKMKQKNVGSGARSARNFIDNVATKSSMTGVSYKMKFADGKEVELKEVLMKKLLEIEAAK